MRDDCGWEQIVFADGTPIAFCSGVWDSAKQRRVIARRDVNHWNLYGAAIGARSVARCEELIARSKADFAGDHRYRLVRKLLKRLQNEQRAKEWDQVITGPIREWAGSRISALAQGLDCVDNDRVALKGNTAQMRRYMRQKNRGCCGFHDSEEVCPVDGRTYLLGFNFGH
jgi:hypothetical protein